MCTNYQNTRRRLREMDDGGSGDRRRGVDGDQNNYSTLLNEIADGGVLTGQYPFLMRLAISSVFLIILLLVSNQLEWASFLFDIAKPMYFVYVGGIAVVDLLAPALKTLDGWLGVQEEIYSDQQDILRAEDEQELEESSSPTTTYFEESYDAGGSSSVSEDFNNMMTDEDFSKFAEEIIVTPGFVDPWEEDDDDDDEDNNNLKVIQTTNDKAPFRGFATAKSAVSSCLSPDTHNNKDNVRRRTWIPAPTTSKGRKVRGSSPGGVKETNNVKLLRALESELRKEETSIAQSRIVTANCERLTNKIIKESRK